MIKKISRGTIPLKPRVSKESRLKYKTRKTSRTRPKRYPGVPLKPEEWDKYRGETIAYVDDKILAHGKDLDVVLQEVWEKYGKKPHQVVLHVVSPYPRMIR